MPDTLDPALEAALDPKALHEAERAYMMISAAGSQNA